MKRINGRSVTKMRAKCLQRSAGFGLDDSNDNAKMHAHTEMDDPVPIVLAPHSRVMLRSPSTCCSGP